LHSSGAGVSRVLTPFAEATPGSVVVEMNVAWMQAQDPELYWLRRYHSNQIFWTFDSIIECLGTAGAD
jgi:hypothetical protein